MNSPKWEAIFYKRIQSARLVLFRVMMSPFAQKTLLAQYPEHLAQFGGVFDAGGTLDAAVDVEVVGIG